MTFKVNIQSKICVVTWVMPRIRADVHFLLSESLIIFQLSISFHLVPVMEISMALYIILTLLLLLIPLLLSE